MKPPERRRIPSPPREWENFLICVMLHMALPLLPLTLEWAFSQTVSDKMMTLAASMYTIAIGLSSRNFLLFGAALFLSICLAAVFGFVASGGGPFSPSGILAIISVAVVFVFHAGERYNRHVVEENPFLEFIKKDS